MKAFAVVLFALFALAQAEDGFFSQLRSPYNNGRFQESLAKLSAKLKENGIDAAKLNTNDFNLDNLQGLENRVFEGLGKHGIDAPSAKAKFQAAFNTENMQKLEKNFMNNAANLGIDLDGLKAEIQNGQAITNFNFDDLQAREKEFFDYLRTKGIDAPSAKAKLQGAFNTENMQKLEKNFMNNAANFGLDLDVLKAKIQKEQGGFGGLNSRIPSFSQSWRSRQ